MTREERFIQLIMKEELILSPSRTSANIGKIRPKNRDANYYYWRWHVNLERGTVRRWIMGEEFTWAKPASDRIANLVLTVARLRA